MAITTLANVKTVLGITDTASDAYISSLIPVVEGDYMLIRNKYFDAGIDGITTVYPAGSDTTATRMIAYLLSAKETGNMGDGVQSESISRYSVTYGERALGYPAGIVAMIKRFARFY